MLLSSAQSHGGVTRTKLHVLDLAGSERVKKTGVTAGTAIEEARATNLSLLSLGKVCFMQASRSRSESPFFVHHQPQPP